MTDPKYQRRDGVDPVAHYIENAVAVYLMRDPDGTDRWVIDPLCLDGGGLDPTYDSYPSGDNCECNDQEACDAALDSMEQTRDPDVVELLHMLADALGYTVTPN